MRATIPTVTFLHCPSLCFLPHDSTRLSIYSTKMFNCNFSPSSRTGLLARHFSFLFSSINILYSYRSLAHCHCIHTHHTHTKMSTVGTFHIQVHMHHLHTWPTFQSTSFWFPNLVPRYKYIQMKKAHIVTLRETHSKILHCPQKLNLHTIHNSNYCIASC